MIERSRFLPLNFFLLATFIVGFALSLAELVRLNCEKKKLEVENLNLKNMLNVSDENYLGRNK